MKTAQQITDEVAFFLQTRDMSDLDRNELMKKSRAFLVEALLAMAEKWNNERNKNTEL